MENKEINVYTYDYEEAVYEDSKSAILDMLTEPDYVSDINAIIDKDNLIEYFDDKLWLKDSVTGNGSGSYTFSRFMAESYLCHNLYLLEEAWKELGLPEKGKGVLDPEACDVTIRCYLLRGQLEKVVDDLIDEGKLPQFKDEEDDTPEEDDKKD